MGSSLFFCCGIRLDSSARAVGDDGVSDEVPRCPYLPAFEAWRTASSMRRFGDDRGPEFYRAALAAAQSRWCSGLPAQAILQLNRAWSADLAGAAEVLREWPSPFRALAWMLDRAPAGAFLGNPVRHFQHLATRMHGVRRAPRVWRAWAAFCLAEAQLDPARFPRDGHQVEREGIVFPDREEVATGLEQVGWDGEAAEFLSAIREVSHGDSGRRGNES